MSNPALATTAEDGSRFYTWRGESFWSVTTIIGGGVPKYGLPAWYAKMAAELAYAELARRGRHSRGHATLRAWAREGRAEVLERQARGEVRSVKLAKLSDEDLALRWLKGEAERVRDAAARKGTGVHDEAESLVLALARETGEAWAAGRPLPAWPDELAPHMRSFAAWLERAQPRYEATEATVFSRAQLYAGTLDAIAEVPWGDGGRRLAVIDYKSGEHVYPEVGLQLAAYARGEFIGSPDGETEVPLPDVGLNAAVLHIRPRGCRLYPVEIGPRVIAAFLYAREVYRWATVIAPDVIGPEIKEAARAE